MSEPLPAAFRDNPDRVLPRTVPLVNGQVCPTTAEEVVRWVVPGWSRAQSVSVTPVQGGITNGLSRVCAAGLSDVLVRVYGPETEVVIDRERENRLFARLSVSGFAPPYLARFQNGRVEGFLPGFRALEPAEMGADRWRAGIARRLAELHAYSPPHPSPRTFSTLRAWLERAASLHFEGPAAEAHRGLQLAAAVARLDALQHHLHTVLVPGARTPGARAALRTVLAHNDLLSGNILVHDTTGEVRFIDYEYGDSGYAAFDVANHFCEYAGFDSNFATGFPDRAVRLDFARHLLSGATPADLDDFDRLVRFFVLVNHLWWGSWAVVQARYSPIDFDFMGYARLRMAGLSFHTDRWGPMGDG
jgi:ethanolamine kinase